MSQFNVLGLALETVYGKLSPLSVCAVNNGKEVRDGVTVVKSNITRCQVQAPYPRLMSFMGCMTGFSRSMDETVIRFTNKLIDDL